ncbi:helix-turn-helix domain-containing protein [Vibrio salinus]|uniref:helix-turn-helix domain-containing protein n=1 Tax=Vibrio salinus TaxID=2899784 RepID=UPI001E61FB34|nr:helix-turn-helix domain-containing protein [Vibrio salinus]MCE0492456.1 helix-turn-helix domain-containing protein [Vibrio salinus]
MSQPLGQLSSFAQAIWSLSLPENISFEKNLYPDARSGILFNLAGEINIDQHTFPEGVIMLPVKRKAEKIALSSGGQLVGIRFQHAVSYGLLGKNLDKPTLHSHDNDQQFHLYALYSELKKRNDYSYQFSAISAWAEAHQHKADKVPESLTKTINFIKELDSPGLLSENRTLSQRQMERVFKLWLGMTPKYYQRILRVKNAILFLKLNQDVHLAEVAQICGFSDQAHMTREFRQLASITPAKVNR